jgi:hypothetical protein
MKTRVGSMKIDDETETDDFSPAQYVRWNQEASWNQPKPKTKRRTKPVVRTYTQEQLAKMAEKTKKAKSKARIAGQHV